VHEITEPTPVARVLVKIPAACFAKIGDGAELHLHLAAFVVASVHDVEGVGRLFFVGEFGVDVAYHVVAEVVAYVEGFDASEFSEFFVQVSGDSA